MRKAIAFMALFIFVGSLVGQTLNTPYTEDFTATLKTGTQLGDSNVWESNPGWTRWNGSDNGSISKYREDNAQWRTGYEAWCLRDPWINNQSHSNGQSAHVIIHQDFKRYLISPTFKSDKKDFSISFDIAMTRDYRTEAGRPHQSDFFAVLVSTGDNNNFKTLRKWDLSGSNSTYDLRLISHLGQNVTINILLDEPNTPFRVAFYAGRDESDSAIVWYFVDNVTIGGDVSIINENKASNLTTISNAFPNPVRTTTYFDITVKENEKADLKIFNVKGQIVKEIMGLRPGNHRIDWDGKDLSGKEVKNGIYFYQLNTPQTTTTKKLVLIK